MTFHEKGSFQLSDGTTGEWRVIKELSHVRFTWQPPGWQRSSTMQIRVIDNGSKTVVALHQEHLPDAHSRQKRLASFQNMLQVFEKLFQTE